MVREHYIDSIGIREMSPEERREIVRYSSISLLCETGILAEARQRKEKRKKGEN
tara:strand:- start:198 stop:359 length:162 start_codon:yes stop_codon:yes gene_type:complete